MNRATVGLLLCFALPEAARCCPQLDLHVAGGIGGPPVFTLFGAVGLPHVRTPAATSELYRLGDATGADSATLTLHAVKGPLPNQVTLHGGPPCLGVVSFADTGTVLRDLHVTTSGTAAGDGTAAAPFDTLEHAAAVVVPGDRILIHAGNYPGSAYIVDLHGTAVNPVVVSGAPGEARPVLGSASVGEAIHLSDPAWVVLQDLVVAGPTGNGINIDDGGDYATPAHHVVVRRVDIHDIGVGGNQDCLKLSGLDDFWVLGSDLSRCGAGGSGIDMVGCHRGLVEGSSFRNTGANAIQAKGGSADCVFRGNLMVDAGDRAMNLGGSTGLPFFRPLTANYEARNLQALANVVVRSQAPVAYVGCDACLVANNTFYLPQKWVARILQESTYPGFLPCQAGRFINNVVVFDHALVSVFVNVGPNTDAPSFSFANNLWFARDDPTFSGPTLPVTESNPVVQQNPLLVDPAGEDFHLDPASPARGRGICLTELTHDRDLVCYHDPPGLGAHEVR